MIQNLKKSVLMLVFLSSNYLLAQQNSLPLNSFFKDKFVEVSGKRSIETFFPANENQLNLNHLIRDSSVQYTDIGIWLFKKHFVSITKPEGNISISPLVDFTFGKEVFDTSRNTLYRNTRGIFVEGELLNKIGFNFIFAENQSKFMQYESDYFNSRGEIRI
jgi:nucleoside-specific outer membrane channel protein Tsx